MSDKALETQETRYKKLFEMCTILVFKMEKNISEGLGKCKQLPYILAYKSRNFARFLVEFFFQFDLNVGQTLSSLKHWKIGYFYILKLLFDEKRLLKFLNFRHIFRLIFSIRVIRRSTYTRVYTVNKNEK
jgi:hypothetical protein